MLRDGPEPLVEGRYQPGGYFDADRLRLKSPSKYQQKAGG